MATFSPAQSQDPPSQGTQTREESTLEVRTAITDAPGNPVHVKANPGVSERDAKVARKNSLREFLATRASRKLDRVGSSSIAESERAKQGLIGALLILLLIIAIFAIVVTLFPGIVELAIIALLIAFFIWLFAISCRNC